MPYVIRERAGEFCVHVERPDGSVGAEVPGGCHPDRAAAERHMAALYANVPDARTAAPCSCQEPTAMLAMATEPFDQPFPVPQYPPSTWFTERPDWLSTPDEAYEAHLAAGGDPGEPPLLKVSVDDEGRVAGYFYGAGQCLVHDHSACVKPSPTRYAAFHQSHVATEDGSLIRCGVIGNVNGHASPLAPVDVAQAHYADPDKQLMAVRAYDDEHGGYILGAMIPTATYGDVALVRRCPLSGDWRPMPAAWWQAHGVRAAVIREHEGYDCIGPTLVTRPGLPLVTRFARDHARAAAMLGGFGGVQLADEEQTMTMTTTTPGPQPAESTEARLARVEARLAQGPPGAEEVPAEPVEEEPTDLEARVTALEEAVNSIIAALEQQMAANVASLPPADEADPWYEYEARTAAQFDTAQRDKMSESGVAMDDGSFPIRNRADLQNAVNALGRAKDPEAAKRHIAKRARAIGAEAWLKEHTSWYTG